MLRRRPFTFGKRGQPSPSTNWAGCSFSFFLVEVDQVVQEIVACAYLGPIGALATTSVQHVLCKDREAALFISYLGEALCPFKLLSCRGGGSWRRPLASHSQPCWRQHRFFHSGRKKKRGVSLSGFVCAESAGVIVILSIRFQICCGWGPDG